MTDPAALVGHFPWYADPTDTTNIDCQCGHKVGKGIEEWASHAAGQLKHVDDSEPWEYCGDPQCEGCLLLGLVEEAGH